MVPTASFRIPLVLVLAHERRRVVVHFNVQAQASTGTEEGVEEFRKGDDTANLNLRELRTGKDTRLLSGLQSTRTRSPIGDQPDALKTKSADPSSHHSRCVDETICTGRTSIQLNSRENAQALDLCEAALAIVESEEDVGLQD